MSFLLKRWVDVAASVEGVQSKALGRLARVCATHYRITFASAFLVVGLLCLGILNFRESSQVDDLWVDINGPTVANRKLVERAMNTSNNVYALLFVFESNANPRLDDVLNLEHMQDAFAFDATLRTLRTPTNGKTLQNLCQRSIRDASECSVSGVLRFWGVNETQFQGSTTDSIKQKMAELNYADGGNVDRTLDMASFRIVSQNPDKAAATGFSMIYLLNDEKSDATQTKDIAEFVGLVETEVAKQRARLSIALLHSESINNALNSVVGRDITLLMIAFILMILFTSVTLGRPSDKIESRFLLATQSVLLVVLAAFAGYVFCFAIGTPFTNLQQILPFLLLGIGIDNAYVIAAAMDHTSRKKNVEERIEEAYRVVGVSITVTSLTDIVALLFSLTSRLPALRIFGIYAAVSVAFIYLAYLTVFPALLALDEHRRTKRKLDVAPCIVSKTEYPPYAETTALRTPTQMVEDLMVAYYVPVLMKIPVKLLVIAAFVAFTAGMGYNLTRIDTAFLLQDLTPSDTAAFKYLSMHSRLYGGSETPGNTLSVYFRDIDYSNGVVQAQMNEYIAKAFANLEMLDKTVTPRNWHSEFSEFARTTVPFSTMPRDATGTYLVGDANFYAALDVFLADPVFNFIYGRDIARNQTTGKITMSKVQFTTKFLNSAQKEVAAYSETRKFEAQENAGFDPKPFLHDDNMVFWEQNSFMVNEAVSLFSLTLASVVIITAFTLVHPVLVLLVTLTLGMIFVDILGILPLMGVKLNSISVTNLVMAIGIVVDPSAHIAHSFGQQDPSLSRHERVALAMKEIGGSVLMGAFTTFLGVLPTLGASSAIFQVFFKCFCTVVLVGVTHGLIWLPVMLSLLGSSFGVKQGPSSNANDRVKATTEQGSMESSPGPKDDVESGLKKKDSTSIRKMNLSGI